MNLDKKKYQKGETIFLQGEMGHTMYEVLSGKVGIFLSYGEEDEQKLVEVGPGESFGEMALIEGLPRSATAVAMEDTLAVEIPGEALAAYFKEKPDEIIYMMRRLSDRLRDLTRDYNEVCAAISEARGLRETKPSESFWTRLKKFAGIYTKMRDAADVEMPKLVRRSAPHAAGFVQHTMSFGEGDVIFRENDESECMYDIHRGVVGIYSGYGTPGQNLLTKLSENQFFGEMGMIEQAPRSATAVALEEGTVVELIYPAQLSNLFQKNPDKVMLILDHLSSRLRGMTSDYLRACKTAAEIQESGGDDFLSIPAETRAWIEYYTMLNQNGIGWY